MAKSCKKKMENNNKNLSNESSVKDNYRKPAGKNDKFYVAGYTCVIANNRGTNKLIDGNYGAKENPLSTDLVNGAKIKVYNGGENEIGTIEKSGIEMGE